MELSARVTDQCWPLKARVSGLTTAGSRAACGRQITVIGIPNCLDYCEIFIVCTQYANGSTGRIIQAGGSYVARRPRVGDHWLNVCMKFHQISSLRGSRYLWCWCCEVIPLVLGRAVAYRGGVGVFKPPLPRNSEDIGGVLDRISKKNRRLNFLLQFTVFSYGCNLLNKGFF